MQEHCVLCYKVTRCYSYKSSLWDIEKAADKPCCLYPSLADRITEVSQTSCHAWKMEVQVAQTGSCGKGDKSDPPHWKMPAVTTQVRTAYLFLGEWLALPFIFAMYGGVPWTMTVRQPFCTLKDCSLDVRHGGDSALDKNHTSSEVAGGKVGGKCNSHCCDPKSKLLRSLLEQNDERLLKTTLPPGPQA